MYTLLDASSTTKARGEFGVGTKVEIGALRAVGAGLSRPECVLAHESGRLFAADWAGKGGVALVSPHGAVRRIEARQELRPNGIALEPGGTFLLTHLGAETGGVFRMDAHGAIAPVLLEIDGRPLPPTNFVLRDADGGLWITVSTRVVPRANDYRSSAATGFVIRMDKRGARIVADGLGYTNECALSADGAYLYVNETFGRRLIRFRVGADGALTDKRILVAFGAGTFPDGLALDEAGGIWIVSIVSNRVLRLDPDGTLATILEDSDPAHVASVEAAFGAGTMGRPHLDRAAGRRLANISSVAFGGPERRTAYLGCLLGDAVHAFDSPFRGLAPPHWRYPLGPLAGDIAA
jgi:sugar lactone lactonase YvrE